MKPLSLVLLLAVLVAIPVLAHNGIDDVHPNESLSLPLGVLKVLEYRNQLAASITFLAAFLAGIISFTSPCGFVLLPTFFAFVFKERKRALLMTALFSLGLVLGFTSLGVAAALLGVYLNQFKEPFAILSGIVFIVFGIMIFFNKGFTWFHYKLNHHHSKRALPMIALGFFFALGWTPCVGPVLGGILLLAANAGTVFTGAAYLAFFALGVALPLLLVSAFADKLDLSRFTQGRLVEFSLFGKKIVTHTYNIISSIILITIGIVMIWWKGTAFFEIYVPWLVPWSMRLFYTANDALTQTPLITSTAGQLIGSILGIAVLALLAWVLYRNWAARRDL